MRAMLLMGISAVYGVVAVAISVYVARLSFATHREKWGTLLGVALLWPAWATALLLALIDQRLRETDET